MTTNVCTKEEIIKTLASQGYFIDSATLNDYFQKWNIEAIFEDDNGVEFYDQNTPKILLNHLFEEYKVTKLKEQEKIISDNTIRNQQTNFQQYNQPIYQQPQQQFNPQFNNSINPNSMLQYTDNEAYNVLNQVSLSDGTPLINMVQNVAPMPNQFIQNTPQMMPNMFPQNNPPLPEENKQVGILEGAIQATGQDYSSYDANSAFEDSIQDGDISMDLDDELLLSESMEAQEKFKEYVISQFKKRNIDISAEGEAQADISERTLSMIARTMAKKIVKHIAVLYGADGKSVKKMAEDGIVFCRK